MSTAKRWLVRPSGFPFGSPGQPIGTVTADDRDCALKLAGEIYGDQVVVEAAHASDIEPRQSLQGSAIAALHAPSAMRAMTAMEIQMARAVGVARIQSKRYKGTIKRLHAESFKPHPEISNELAAQLRSIVRTCSSSLPIEIVEAVGAMP